MNLRTWKVIKNLIVSIAIVGFAIFAIGEGADPLQVFSLAIIVLGLVNGMEVSEFYAAWAEVQTDSQDDSESSSNNDSGS